MKCLFFIDQHRQIYFCTMSSIRLHTKNCIKCSFCDKFFFYKIVNWNSIGTNKSLNHSLNKSPSLQKFSFVKLGFNEKLNIVFCGRENTFETFKMIVLIISFLKEFSLFFFVKHLWNLGFHLKLDRFSGKWSKTSLSWFNKIFLIFFFYLLSVLKSNQSSLVLETWHVPFIQINVRSVKNEPTKF